MVVTGCWRRLPSVHACACARRVAHAHEQEINWTEGAAPAGIKPTDISTGIPIRKLADLFDGMSHRGKWTEGGQGFQWNPHADAEHGNVVKFHPGFVKVSVN